MDFKFLQQIIKQIIDAIQNTGVAAVRSLNKTITTHTYSVDVKNPVKQVTVEGRVKVQNQKDLEKEVKRVADAVKNLEKILAPLKSIKVDNLSDLPKFPEFPEFPKFPEFPEFPKHPKEIEVSNLKDVIEAITELADAVDDLKLDPKINVAAPIVNVPKADPPIVKVEKPDFSQIKKLVEFFEKLSAKNPLPARLTDGAKFYKAVDRLADSYTANAQSDFQTFDGSSGRAIINRNNELQVTMSETWDLNNSHEVDDDTTYVGEESVDGAWRIRLVDKSAGITTVTYATSRNNSSVTSYPSAWTDRLTLTYGRVSEAL